MNGNITIILVVGMIVFATLTVVFSPVMHFL
jgi:hypothetical protein